MFQGTEGGKLYQSYNSTLLTLAQTSRETFCTLEQTVCKDDLIKTNVQDGMVHPLTSNVVNLVKLLSEYQNVLEKLLYAESRECDCMDMLSRKSAQIFTALLSTLETKSRLHKDSALAQIFLMNNAQYIISSVQRCKAQYLLGAEWLQRHQSIVQLHATGYLHAAWDKVLRFLNVHRLMDDRHDMVGTRLSRSLLKERLKKFNQIVDELCQKQKQWTVQDPQLKTALQKAVVESVVPTYRLFLKQFSEGADRSKNIHKYVRYTVEELGHQLQELFEGKSS
ncbi:hypothetical protein L7F22_031621 [Adiantum nelumboides]|nr:hypothetical protein [Adiantum nelumboides]